jgi:hypothetical protein
MRVGTLAPRSWLHAHVREAHSGQSSPFTRVSLQCRVVDIQNETGSMWGCWSTNTTSRFRSSIGARTPATGYAVVG